MTTHVFKMAVVGAVLAACLVGCTAPALAPSTSTQESASSGDVSVTELLAASGISSVVEGSWSDSVTTMPTSGYELGDLSESAAIELMDGFAKATTSELVVLVSAENHSCFAVIEGGAVAKPVEAGRVLHRVMQGSCFQMTATSQAFLASTDLGDSAPSNAWDAVEELKTLGGDSLNARAHAIKNGLTFSFAIDANASTVPAVLAAVEFLNDEGIDFVSARNGCIEYANGDLDALRSVPNYEFNLCHP